jgi:ribosomal protein S16
MRKPRNGGYLEAVGQYDPNANPIGLSIREARIEHWLRKGAQPSDTVRWTLIRQGKDEAAISKVMERWQMQQVDRSQRETDRKTRRASKKKKATAAAAEVTPAPTVA